jgi:hypothetical protein
MFALISPNEEAWSNSNPPQPAVILGQRVAEVSASEFPVASPLFWLPCANDVVADQYYYDPADQQIKAKPV